jgi:hypothetical protein
MSDNTSIPILLDGDTGYGNFNNARRLIRKLEQRGIAGVCIEDKLFPKTNSLLEGVSQPLADIDEFCGKIQACKDAQKDDAFSGTLYPPYLSSFNFSFHLSISSSSFDSLDTSESIHGKHTLVHRMTRQRGEILRPRRVSVIVHPFKLPTMTRSAGGPHLRGSPFPHRRPAGPPLLHSPFILFSLSLIVLFMFECCGCWLADA